MKPEEKQIRALWRHTYGSESYLSITWNTSGKIEILLIDLHENLRTKSGVDRDGYYSMVTVPKSKYQHNDNNEYLALLLNATWDQLAKCTFYEEPNKYLHGSSLDIEAASMDGLLRRMTLSGWDEPWEGLYVGKALYLVAQYARSFNREDVSRNVQNENQKRMAGSSKGLPSYEEIYNLQWTPEQVLEKARITTIEMKAKEALIYDHVPNEGQYKDEQSGEIVKYAIDPVVHPPGEKEFSYPAPWQRINE